MSCFYSSGRSAVTPFIALDTGLSASVHCICYYLFEILRKYVFGKLMVTILLDGNVMVPIAEK